MITIAVVAMCFYVQWVKVAENAEIIEKIMAAVHRKQAARRAS
jgi:hypothetical protein